MTRQRVRERRLSGATGGSLTRRQAVPVTKLHCAIHEHVERPAADASADGRSSSRSSDQ
jgi:hypothetical protein